MIDVSKLKPLEIKLNDGEKPNFTNWVDFDDVSDEYSQVLCSDNTAYLYMFFKGIGYIETRFSMGCHIPRSRDMLERSRIPGSSRFENNDSNFYSVISTDFRYVFFVVKIYDKNDHTVKFYSRPFPSSENKKEISLTKNNKCEKLLYYESDQVDKNGHKLKLGDKIRIYGGKPNECYADVCFGHVRVSTCSDPYETCEYDGLYLKYDNEEITIQDSLYFYASDELEIINTNIVE